MKFPNKFSVALLDLSTVFASATAFSTTLNERQANQRMRIAQGVQSGELTALETKKVLAGQAQLQRMETRAKADGVVTRKERAKLQQKASLESAKIKHNKQDKQSRS